MRFTISDCISRINQTLNYPALSYEDVSHFFDQAISELNPSLRISIPTVSEMRDEHDFKVSDSPNTIILNTIPTPGSYIETVSSLPVVSDSDIVYYNGGTSKLDNTLYVKKNSEWTAVKEAYGLVAGSSTAYKAIIVDRSYAIWYETPMNYVTDFSLTEYLTTDWIILFLIPYVCFKFSVRNGDSGALFSDEFTQGFQQLQTSYNVPNCVRLNTVAHVPAYKKLVIDNINNLSEKVVTRAITEAMRVSNGIRAVYGNTLFENGGWGI